LLNPGPRAREGGKGGRGREVAAAAQQTARFTHWHGKTAKRRHPLRQKAAHKLESSGGSWDAQRDSVRYEAV